MRRGTLIIALELSVGMGFTVVCAMWWGYWWSLVISSRSGSWRKAKRAEWMVKAWLLFQASVGAAILCSFSRVVFFVFTFWPIIVSSYIYYSVLFGHWPIRYLCLTWTFLYPVICSYRKRYVVFESINYGNHSPYRYWCSFIFLILKDEAVGLDFVCLQ